MREKDMREAAVAKLLQCQIIYSDDVKCNKGVQKVATTYNDTRL